MLHTMLIKCSDLESKLRYYIQSNRETIEANKRKDYTNNYSKSLKEIYGLVSECLLLAKCKLISKYLNYFNVIKNLM